MQWQVLAPTPGTLDTVLDALAAAGTSWAVFGTTVFTWTDAGSRKLHLVVQAGRSFQRAHPEVPVLLDTGRHLVVAIEPESVNETTSVQETTSVHETAPDAGHEADYAIEPLADRRVVYTRRTSGAAERRAATPLGPVDTAAFTAYLTHLTALHTRLSTSPLYREAADWAAHLLREWGYAVHTPQSPVATAGTSSNVVARKPGGAADRHEVLVTAHLDSVNHEGGPDAPAPGADDNASGVAGALEIARLLASLETEHDVTIVLFGGEEQGLYGSRAYVAALSPADRERIRAVINMDMIGRVNADPPTVLLEGAPISSELIDRLADAAATHTTLAVETSLNPYASDHVPFLEAGIPAVLTIEGGDAANDAVHTARDTADLVTPDFAARIITVVGTVVADLVGRDRAATGGGDPP